MHTERAPLPATDLALRHATDNHRKERIDAQLVFAERLCEFHPGEAAAWKAAIAAARAAFDGSADTATGLAAAEAQLAGIAVVAKTHAVHCVGHAHIDMNWMWGWPETVATTLDTFRTVLRLMEEFPAFTFGQSQASVYRIVEEHEPEMLERIRARVQEGRWEVLAAHWVEGDRNLAGGEALCRHLVETRAYIQQLFGLTPEQVPVDWSPDTFGHANTMPGIDVRGGAKYLYCCRTGDLTRPAVFWWQGLDGTRQLVHREIAWYNNAAGPEHATRHLLDFRAKTGLRDWMLVYGIGDHGGGPTRRDLRRIIDMDGWPCFPQFRFGRVDRFFALLEKEGERWPVLDHELNFEFTGCYTSQSAIKRANRIGETLCAAADGAVAMAERLTGRAAKPERLHQAWRNVLFNHFHDILPGSGVADTRQYTQGLSQTIQAVAGQERQQALRAIAEQVDTRFAGQGRIDHALSGITSLGVGGGSGRIDGNLTRAAVTGDGPRPVVVFNPTAWPRTELAQVTVWDGDAQAASKPLRDREFTIVRADGSRTAPQRSHHSHYWGHEFVDLFVPVQVPALGWVSLAVIEEKPPAQENIAEALVDEHGGHGQRSNQSSGSMRIRNELLEVHIDRRKGGIARIVDRATGRDLVARDRGCAQLEVQRERPVGMSAWIIGDPQGEPSDGVVTNVWIHDRGPLRSAIHVQLRFGESTATVVYGLTAGSRKVEVTIETRWVERGSPETGIPRLQMRFPAGFPVSSARYETPFGAVTRPSDNGKEVPTLRWAAADGADASLVLLNDGKHGHNLGDDGTLRVSLIRSSYEPDPIPEVADHKIRLALVPFASVPTVEECNRLAAEHDQPLAPVSTGIHAGPLPATTALVGSATTGVQVTQFKRAEDGKGLILRVQNTTAAKIDAAITLDAVLGKLATATTTDILERPSTTDGKASLAGSTVKLAIGANSFATVRLQ